MTHIKNGKHQRRVRSTVREYAIYCAFRRALKQHPAFRAGGDGIVVLTVPKDGSATDYLNAAKAELLPSDPNFFQNDVGVMVVENGKKKRWIASEFESECREKRRLIVISEVKDDLPPSVILATEAVTEITDFTARDLKAACAVVLRMTLTDKDAEQLLQHPISNIAAALQKGRSISNALKRLEAVTASEDTVKPDAFSDTIALEGMYGYGPAKEWGMQLAQDLADWKDGKIDWADVDRGILLSGPPGVGKSIFARALAKQCDVKLVATSLGQWQSTGHLGDLLKAMRKDFATARDEAPALLFIDEIDSVGDRLRFSDDHKSYSVQVVNALLECLDGLGGREGVVVIGATNNPGEIDAAVRRSGRLDRHIEIPLPSAEDRIAILGLHLGNTIPTENVTDIQLATEGLTGADLSRVAREARRAARRAKRDVSLEDIRAALPPLFKIEGDHRYALAVHEAGHTVVGLHLKHGKYLGTRIVNQVIAGVEMQQGGAAYFEVPSVTRRDRQFYLNWIAVTLAGLAAEEIVLGGRGDGAGSDLSSATRLATMIEVNFGMGSSLIYSRAKNERELEELRRFDPALAERVDKLLNEQFERARELILDGRQLLDAIAGKLFDDGVLDADHLSDLEWQGVER